MQKLSEDQKSQGKEVPVIKCTNFKCDFFQVGEPDNCSKPLHLIAECPEAVVRKTEVGGQRSSSFAKASTFAKASVDGSEDREVRNDKAFYLAMVRSDQCLCERGKKAGNAFCFRCFKLLPRHLQKELYKPVGRGFEEAYEAAVMWLGENAWK
jgi:hypothetical protein